MDTFKKLFLYLIILLFNYSQINVPCIFFCESKKTILFLDVVSLRQDYKKVLLEGQNHDLILKVGNKELRAHRDILRARSKVFESMLSHNMIEKNNGIVDVPDCDPQAMEQFLSYLYCGKVETLNQSNMFGLYYIADKYEMLALKEECCEFIKKSLSLTNTCKTIQLALSHSDSNLLEYATDYFGSNMLDIMRTDDWQCFLKDNFTLGNELIIKCVEKLKNIRNC